MHNYPKLQQAFSKRMVEMYQNNIHLKNVHPNYMYKALSFVVSMSHKSYLCPCS